MTRRNVWRYLRAIGLADLLAVVVVVVLLTSIVGLYTWKARLEQKVEEHEQALNLVAEALRKQMRINDALQSQILTLQAIDARRTKQIDLMVAATRMGWPAATRFIKGVQW